MQQVAQGVHQVEKGSSDRVGSVDSVEMSAQVQEVPHSAAEIAKITLALRGQMMQFIF